MPALAPVDKPAGLGDDVGVFEGGGVIVGVPVLCERHFFVKEATVQTY